MRRMLKKDLTRFMLSLSRLRQIRESKRKVVLTAGCAGKGYEIESQPGTDTKTIHIFLLKEYFYASMR